MLQLTYLSFSVTAFFLATDSWVANRPFEVLLYGLASVGWYFDAVAKDFARQREAAYREFQRGEQGEE